MIQEHALYGVTLNASRAGARLICRFIGSTGHIPKGTGRFLAGIHRYVQPALNCIESCFTTGLIRLFKILYDSGQESARFATGNAAVIEGQRQGNSGMDFNASGLGGDNIPMYFASTQNGHHGWHD